jgi:hypothetical protein
MSGVGSFEIILRRLFRTTSLLISDRFLYLICYGRLAFHQLIGFDSNHRTVQHMIERLTTHRHPRRNRPIKPKATHWTGRGRRVAYKR